MSKLSVIYQFNKINKIFGSDVSEKFEKLTTKEDNFSNPSFSQGNKPLTRKELEKLLAESGLKSIDSYEDLSDKYSKVKGSIDYFVINTLDKDPSSNLNKALLKDSSKDIKYAIEELATLYDIKNYILVVNKDNKVGSENIISSLPSKDIRIIPAHHGWLGDDFVCENLNLPKDSNIIVESPLNLYYIHQLINIGRVKNYLISVNGENLAKKGNFIVDLGTSYKEIVDLIGGFKEEPYKIICGGIFKGTGVYSLEDKVKPGDYALLFLTEKQCKKYTENPCIRCGQCVSICPKKLIPLKLNEFALERNYDRFNKAKGIECIDCGLCSYVCPSKRHLSQSISTAKKLIQKSN